MNIQPHGNYTLRVEGNRLIVEMLLDEIQVEAHLSASGKSVILATTGGAVPVPGTALKLNLTLYRKP